jgi:hypothetical protein
MIRATKIYRKPSYLLNSSGEELKNWTFAGGTKELRFGYTVELFFTSGSTLINSDEGEIKNPR